MKLPDKHKAPDCIGDYASTDSYNEGFEEGFNSCLDEVVAMNSDTLTIPRADLERLQRDAERWQIVHDDWLDDEDAKMAQEYADEEIAHRAALAPSKGTDNGEGVNREG